MLKKVTTVTYVLIAILLVPTLASAQYKYEYKYGPGQYNYDVEGYDDDGNYVFGNLDTNDKYVDGYITDESGEEKYFDGEFTDYGVIEGYDEDGNYIELEVD